MQDTTDRNILVVDDDSTSASLVRYNLQHAGYVVTVASNGQEAWDAAQHKQFDLVVSDEQMPIMCGEELCRRLRQSKRYCHTPIIFLTSKRFEMDTELITRDLRVTAVLSKPFSPKGLVDAIETVLTAPAA